MFYQCPKCKNIWQYPIEKCPECFLNLQPLKSGNLKVIAISRVLIPSPLHPKVPYFVLLLEDEKGKKFVQKSAKEYRIGENFEIKKGKNKNGVAIWRVKYDIFEAVEKVISLLDEIKIDETKKILILPTLVSVSHPYLGENTHPEVLDFLLKFLIQRGAKKENIKVVGQSQGEAPLESIAKKSQILSICSENKIEFFDLEKGEFKRIEKGNLVFEISKEIFENDLLINLPILKIDQKLGIKGALENLTRLWKKESFLGQKYLYGEGELIFKLKDVLPEARLMAGRPEILTIADGTVIQKSNREAVILDLILASFNSLNLDRVFAEISMIQLPEYLKSVKIEGVEVLGRQIEEVKIELEKI